MLRLIYLCVHILAVIAFVGYIFFDELIYKRAYKTCPKEACDAVKKGFTKASALVLGLSFILILLSGYLLLSYYQINSFKELVSSAFGVFLSIKLFLILLMILLTGYSIFFIRVLKRSDPFKGKSHLYALILCVLVVVLAVFMTRV